MRTLDTLIVNPLRAGRKGVTTILPPGLRRQLAKQQIARDAALKVLESQPGFVSAQVKMRDDLAESDKKISNEASRLGTKARFEYALNRFDIRVRPYLELVRDITVQNAFIVWLQACADLAWREYQGDPPWLLQPVNIGEGSDAWVIKTKTNEWTTEGYRRLDSLQQQAAADSRVESAPSSESLDSRSCSYIERSIRTYGRAREQIEYERLLDEMRKAEEAKKTVPSRSVDATMDEQKGGVEEIPNLEELPRGKDDVAAKRGVLLAEYKRKTSASNRSIYQARNSGINKPEFYAWLSGELPETSKTTIKFEKFLLSSKSPIPKKPKH